MSTVGTSPLLLVPPGGTKVFPCPLMDIDEHSKSINAAFVSGDGVFMVSVSLDNTVRTWSNFILPGSKPACEVGSCHLGH